MPQDNLDNKKTLQEIHEYHEVEEKTPRRWPVILGYLWAAFLVALVVVFGGRWIYNSVNDDVSKSSGQVAKNDSDKKSDEAVIVPASPGSGKVSQPSKPSNTSSSSSPSTVAGTGDSDELPTAIPNTGDDAIDPNNL